MKNDHYIEFKMKKYFLNIKMVIQDVAQIYNGILLSHKKECSLALCSNMDGFVGHYAK